MEKQRQRPIVAHNMAFEWLLLVVSLNGFYLISF